MKTQNRKFLIKSSTISNNCYIADLAHAENDAAATTVVKVCIRAV